MAPGREYMDGVSSNVKLVREVAIVSDKKTNPSVYAEDVVVERFNVVDTESRDPSPNVVLRLTELIEVVLAIALLPDETNVKDVVVQVMFSVGSSLSVLPVTLSSIDKLTELDADPESDGRVVAETENGMELTDTIEN